MADYDYIPPQSPVVVADVEQIVAGTPASATDTGTAGQMLWDADYLYVCVATDTWKRVGLSTWP